MAAIPAELVSQTVLDLLPGAILVEDSDGKIVFANDRAARLFGYSSDELLGQPFDILLSHDDGKVHSHHRNLLVQFSESSVTTSIRLSGRKRDGRLFPVEMSLVAARTAEGFREVCVIDDTGQQKQSKEVLRAWEERYQLLVEGVKDYSIIMLDAVGDVLTWNEGARRTRGYAADEVLGRSFSMFFTPEDIEAGKPGRELKEAAEKGKVEVQGWRVRKDGTRFLSEIVLTAIRGSDGRLAGFTKIARDITKRKRASESVLLEISNRLVPHLRLGEMLDAVAASLRQIKEYDYASLAVCDPTSRKLRIYALPTPSRGPLNHENLALRLQTSPEAWAFKAREGLILNRLSEQGMPIEFPDRLFAQGLRSVCRLPLIASDQVLGTLNLGSLSENAFSEEEVAILSEVAHQIALTLGNVMSFYQLSELKEKLAEEKQYLEGEIRGRLTLPEIVGQSPRLKEVLQQVERVARTDSTVLIVGETGTGKELIARAVHDLSARHNRSFITINCSALPADLFESELFGHEKGAFTGSAARKIGRIELAHRGTLFLDEVGDIPLGLQPKLLRALQQKQFERLGGVETLTVDVRLVAATHRDLEALVKEERFRSDLYYRLNVFPITVPALRERPEDIPLLAQYFLIRHSRGMGKKVESISAEAMQELCCYSWPGNIRELDHFIERAVILSSGPVLCVPPLASGLRHEPVLKPVVTPPEAEREQILRVLRETNGIIGGPRGAAARLGLKRTTLSSKIRRLGISRHDFLSPL